MVYEVPPPPLAARILQSFDKLNDVWKVSHEMNIEPDLVRYHLRNAGRKLPAGSYKARPDGKSSSMPLSQLHSSVGAKIGYLRMNEGYKLTAEFAEHIGMAAKRYGGIERGTYDATMSDLARVSVGLRVELHELLTPLKFKIQGSKE